MIKIYEYSGCSTCKKALKFLDGRGVTYERVDITQTPPTKKELKAALASVGGQIRKLFNTSGLVYKEMKLSETLAAMGEDEALALLAGNGRLVKRPLLMDGESVLIGFDETRWQQIL